MPGLQPLKYQIRMSMYQAATLPHAEHVISIEHQSQVPIRIWS